MNTTLQRNYRTFTVLKCYLYAMILSRAFHKINTIKQNVARLRMSRTCLKYYKTVDAPFLLEQIHFRVPRKQERISRKKTLFAI